VTTRRWCDPIERDAFSCSHIVRDGDAETAVLARLAHRKRTLAEGDGGELKRSYNDQDRQRSKNKVRMKPAKTLLRPISRRSKAAGGDGGQ
jgi:hypothetical protein